MSEEKTDAWESKWADDVPIFIGEEEVPSGPVLLIPKGVGVNVRSTAPMSRVRESWNKYFQKDVSFEEDSHIEEELIKKIPSLHQKRNRLKETRIRVDETQQSNLTKRQQIPPPLALCLGAYCEESPIYKDVNKSLRERNFEEFPIYVNCLLKALRHLPYDTTKTLYRGMATNAGKAWTTNDFDVDGLITYNGFTSLSKNKITAQRFAKDGLILEVSMQTGRDISLFSPYGEGEVLLPPMTILQVKEIREKPPNLVVKLEELQIWKGSHCVLWIDDHPEGNYDVMQKAEQGSDVNFVIVTSTLEAVGFMEYESNINLKNLKPSSFRIVTDMYRDTEPEDQKTTAGAIVIKELAEKIGYKETVMVYVGNKRKTEEHMRRLDVTNCIVTNNENECIDFCSFKD